MDGLMFDTEKLNHKTVDILLGRRGFRYTDELKREVMGRPARYNAELFVRTFNLPETWEEISRESLDIFLKLLKKGVRTMPGLFELFDTLEDAGIPKCVATSATRFLAGVTLEQDNLCSRFSFIITADDISRGKPDPQIYQLAAQKFCVPPNEMIVFEDSAAGIRSAKSAGAYCAALRAEHNQNVDLSEADLIVETLNDPRIFAVLKTR